MIIYQRWGQERSSAWLMMALEGSFLPEKTEQPFSHLPIQYLLKFYFTVNIMAHAIRKENQYTVLASLGR